MSAPDKIWVNTDDSEDGCCPVETDLDDVGKYFNASRATCYTRTDLMPPAADYVAEGLAHIVEYTNWRGETARRVVRPIRMWWGKTERHPEEQWMLTAWDCEKEAIRDFAWQDMRPVQNPATSAAALAARPAPQPAAEHEYPDPLIAEDRYEDDQPAADTPAMNDELATMISDLSHTGELSMPYRLEIADRVTALRAALDAAEARAVGEHDPECRLVERGQTCNCGAALPPASPLGAVVMREKAARIAEDRNDEIWDIYTGEKVGLDGCAEKIRAIPLPTDDELFAAAAELLAKHFASLSPEELGRFELAVEIDGAIAALAPFTRKGE